MIKEQKSQLEEANEALIALLPNIAASDRVAAQKSYSRSRMTIHTYLKGQGKELDTAIELLEFFRRRIEKRAKVIANETTK